MRVVQMSETLFTMGEKEGKAGKWRGRGEMYETRETADGGAARRGWAGCLLIRSPGDVI